VSFESRPERYRLRMMARSIGVAQSGTRKEISGAGGRSVVNLRGRLQDMTRPLGGTGLAQSSSTRGAIPDRCQLPPFDRQPCLIGCRDRHDNGDPKPFARQLYNTSRLLCRHHGSGAGVCLDSPQARKAASPVFPAVIRNFGSGAPGQQIAVEADTCPNWILRPMRRPYHRTHKAKS